MPASWLRQLTTIPPLLGVIVLSPVENLLLVRLAEMQALMERNRHTEHLPTRLDQPVNTPAGAPEGPANHSPVDAPKSPLPSAAPEDNEPLAIIL